jgi:hypothetical protein
MSDITQAIGDLAQAGLTASAAEPAHGEGAAPEAEADGHTDEAACLNCGAALVGAHCHACGQRGHVHKTLGAFFHDLLHGVFHFEGKVWRTLPMLAWDPGRLTREYIDGRRASYVSPIALFLLVIFLFFAVFNALGVEDKWAEGVRSSTTVETQQAIDTAAAEIARARARLAREDDADDIAELNDKIASLERQRTVLQTALRSGGPGIDFEDGKVAVTGSGARSAWEKAKANPQLLMHKFMTNAYKFAWLLIPISVPFVALTFLWRRQFGLYDHTVFTTYSITFMFALVAVATLAYLVSGWLTLAILLYAPVHMYRQLRGTYALRRFSAVWRTIVLSVFAQWVMIIFAGMMSAMAES